jgi:hypothetical protein
MRKWVVDSDGPHPYKLVASWHRPEKSYCEAPDFFTRNMEPHIILGQDSEDNIVALLSNNFYEEHELKNKNEHEAKLLEMNLLKLALKKAEEKRKFNQLPKHKRLFRSLLKERKKK